MGQWLQITGDKVTNAAVFAENKTPESLGFAGHWIQHDTAGIGWTLKDGELVAPPVAPVVVPQTITRRQGRIALMQAGKLDAAEAIVMAGGLAAQIEYEAAAWERGNEYLRQIWALLGGSDKELDALFVLAASL